MAKNSKLSTKNTIRTRNYATILYTESAPSNWLDILQDLAIPCFVSPYHDSDLNPTDEQKKPHYHIMLMFDSVKTLEQVKRVVKKFGGIQPKRIDSVRGYARYLCHLDNPEKFQYDIANVRAFGGADYLNTINLVTDKYTAIADMVVYCTENNITSYAQLFMYCIQDNFAWLRVLCDCGTLVISAYLKSFKEDNEKLQEEKPKKLHFLSETQEEIGG